MMMKMKNKQYGIGFLGWSSILGVLAFFVLIGLRIFPLYSEKMTVLTSMESVANRPDAKTLSPTKLRDYFRKNIEVSSNSMRFSNQKLMKNLVKIEKDKKTKKKYLRVTYEGRNKFVKDLEFALLFDHKIELGGSGDE